MAEKMAHSSDQTPTPQQFNSYIAFTQDKASILSTLRSQIELLDENSGENIKTSILSALRNQIKLLNEIRFLRLQVARPPRTNAQAQEHLQIKHRLLETEGQQQKTEFLLFETQIYSKVGQHLTHSVIDSPMSGYCQASSHSHRFSQTRIQTAKSLQLKTRSMA